MRMGKHNALAFVPRSVTGEAHVLSSQGPAYRASVVNLHNFYKHYYTSQEVTQIYN